MKKNFIFLGIGVSGLLVLGGCFSKPARPYYKSYKPVVLKKKVNTIKKVQYDNRVCIINSSSKKTCILTIEAVGVGVSPCNGACSMAQARVMARRAAILDGYKALVEKLYGIKINGRDTVKNMVLQSSSLRAHLEGVIRNAVIEDESFKNGIYKVTMSVKVNVQEWNKYLQNMPSY